MSFYINQRMLMMIFKFISISCIVLIMLFLYITLNSVNNDYKDIIHNKWMITPSFIKHNSDICKLNFFDCSLALLLGLFISSKRLRLLGIV
jgi:hypothetical protein